MDTYMSRFNASLFEFALGAYAAAGCKRVAAGLLVGEGGNSTASVAALFAAVERAAERQRLGDLAVWVNLWQAQETLNLWRPYLEHFLRGGPSDYQG
jgi:hypothetical protein